MDGKTDALSHVDTFDVVLLVERLPEAMFPNVKAFTSPALKLSDSPGRISGGVALLIKNDYSRSVTQICLEFENVVVVKISKQLMDTD